MQIQPFYDERTSTLTWVVFSEATRDAVIIDPVLDYEPGGGKLWTESVEKVAAFVDEQKLKVHYVLETHVHADHLSGSQWLKKRFGAKIAVSHRITEVQEVFKGVFGWASGLTSRGLSLIVFPEGTRSPDGRVGIFKGGSFYLAMQAGLPIVPLSIVGSRHVMRKGQLTTKPGHVTLIIHDPIATTSNPDPPTREVRALANSVRAIVRPPADAEAMGESPGRVTATLREN